MRHRRHALLALRTLPGCYLAMAGLRSACGGASPVTNATCSVSPAACANPALIAARAAVPRSFQEGSDFRIVRRESGSVRTDLPIFTNFPGTLQLSQAAEKPAVVREDLPQIPGAFLLHNVLSDDECNQLIALSEAMGFTEDAPVSLGRNIRKNDNCVWIADEEMNGAFFDRCRPHLPEKVAGGVPVGLNARWRLYRYNPDDIFRAHTDGSWPGSGLDPKTGELVQDIWRDRWSQLTWVAYLNDDFDGGATRFAVMESGGQRVEEAKAKRGSVLCFFHGEHPLSPLHEGGLVNSGTKYIIRSDVLYTLPGVTPSGL